MTDEFKITSHVLVPEHKKLSDKDKKELLDKYNISLKQLPKIQSTDPVLQTLEVVPGDVIQIMRKSDLVGESPYYRVVVHGKRV